MIKRIAKVYERAKRNAIGKTFTCQLERNMYVADFLVANGVVAVRHGEWVQIGYDKAMDRITCSCCKEYWNICDNDTHTFNYCPNCGAKMDGKGEGE